MDESAARVVAAILQLADDEGWTLNEIAVFLRETLAVLDEYLAAGR